MSAGAEFVAASALVQEVMYARSLLEKLWFPQPDPTCIYEDNQTCISWSKCSVGGTDWAAHIDLRLGEHFVHDAVEAKTLLGSS